MTHEQIFLVVDSINRIFRSKRFNNHAVYSCMCVAGTSTKKDRDCDFYALSLYHGVKFSEMTTEVKEIVFKLTLKVITRDAFPALKVVRDADFPIVELVNGVSPNSPNYAG